MALLSVQIIGALLAYKGDYREAQSLLSKAANQILSAHDFSPYSIYFLFSNLAVVDWLNGEDMAASTPQAFTEFLGGHWIRI
jgi:hypothetical protein